MEESSTEDIVKDFSSDETWRPNELTGSTRNDGISDSYPIIFIAVAVFTVLYLVVWYFCLKCCCYSLRQCFENKLIARGEVIHSAPQLPSIPEEYIQNHCTTNDSSPLMRPRDGNSPHFQLPPLYPPPPKYEDSCAPPRPQRYQRWNSYMNQQFQQNSAGIESNDRECNRVTPPPPYEENFKI